MNIEVFFPLLAPWIGLSFILLLVIILLTRKYKAALLLLFLLIAVDCIWRIFPFKNLYPVGDICFRVFEWNANYSDRLTQYDANVTSFVLENNADFVFLSEYSSTFSPKVDSALCETYPYKREVKNDVLWNDFYSMYPIKSYKVICDNERGFICVCDLNFNNIDLRLYCLHLHSNNLVNGETFYPDSIADRGGIERYLENYKAASEIRREQAELIMRDLSDAPCIVMGDMNDVCGSPCMKVFADAGLRDAWWEGGFGYGATIHRPLPYRIDHVMYGKGLKLKGIKKVSSKGLSDHDALVADFTLHR